MSPETIFNLHLILGYVAWLLCFRAYLLPRLKAMEQVEAHRAIATLHSFRFFGLVFILPGVVGNLPASFATFAAYWDLATGVLAMLERMERPPARQHGCSGVKDRCAARGRQNAGLGARDPILPPLRKTTWPLCSSQALSSHERA